MARSVLGDIREGVLGIILVPAVVQSLARSGQANGRDKLQVETGLAEMMRQSTVIIAGNANKHFVPVF